MIDELAPMTCEGQLSLLDPDLPTPTPPPPIEPRPTDDVELIDLVPVLDSAALVVIAREWPIWDDEDSDLVVKAYAELRRRSIGVLP